MRQCSLSDVCVCVCVCVYVYIYIYIYIYIWGQVINHMAYYPPRPQSPSNKNEKGDVVTHCYNFNAYPANVENMVSS